jgi:hypothetical protein
MMDKERMCYAVVILIVLIVVSGGNNKIYDYFTTSTTISNYDQRAYKVVGGFTDKDVAADKLAKLHEFIVNYLRFVKTKFIINNEGSVEHELFFKRVLKNYNPDVIFENDPKPGEETSFVADKGKEFGICLRKKGSLKDQMHEMSILKFVMLHELTHLGCISYGHDAEFWGSFKMVLAEAVASGLYTPVDYSHNPVNYCGLTVSSNPYCSGNNKCSKNIY